MRRPLIWFAAVVSHFAVSCQAPGPSPQEAPTQTHVPSAVEETEPPSPARESVDLSAVLRTRADGYWRAQVAEDWGAVFDYLDPGIRSEWEKAAFVAWSEENEPFLIRKFAINDVMVADDFGWVDIDYTTNIRQFPDVPPKDASKLEKWWHREGAWYVVPQQLLDQVPAPPSQRDADAEARVRQRWEASWEARLNRNWRQLWELVDPRDKVGVLYEDFAEVEGLIEYFSYELYWVQVIGSDGKVRVNYEHRLHDPNLTKMQPIFKTITETWSLHEGQWYLNRQQAN